MTKKFVLRVELDATTFQQIESNRQVDRNEVALRAIRKELRTLSDFNGAFANSELSERDVEILATEASQRLLSELRRPSI